jgi:hypothetical protein
VHLPIPIRPALSPIGIGLQIASSPFWRVSDYADCMFSGHPCSVTCDSNVGIIRKSAFRRLCSVRHKRRCCRSPDRHPRRSASALPSVPAHTSPPPSYPISATAWSSSFPATGGTIPAGAARGFAGSHAARRVDGHGSPARSRTEPRSAPELLGPEVNGGRREDRRTFYG